MTLTGQILAVNEVVTINTRAMYNALNCKHGQVIHCEWTGGGGGREREKKSDELLVVAVRQPSRKEQLDHFNQFLNGSRLGKY